MRIAFVSHQVLLLDGLRPYLASLCQSGALVEASTLREFRSALQADTPVDVAIVDFCMPGVRFPDIVADLKQQRPETRIVVLGPALHRSFILDVLGSGADGYISKQMNANAMVSAIRLVANGEPYVPAAVLSMPADVNSQVCGHRLTPDDPCGSQGLTDREREILRLLREGMPNKVIATTLDISVVTVKSHLSKVFRKIGAKNRVHALRLLATADDGGRPGYTRACC